MTNLTKLGQHLTSAFGIADIKAYLGLQRSDDLYMSAFGQHLTNTNLRVQGYQGKGIFLNFMILLDSYYDFEENEVLFVKMGARVPDIWLDTSFGPKSKLQSLGIHRERIPCTFLRR